MSRQLAVFACTLLLTATFAPGDLFSADARPALAKSALAAKTAKAEVTTLEMFAAMKSGDIEVTFIPKDATEANVLFKNKTGKPVAIKLPEAFAGVPVLAQFGGGGMMGGGGMGGMGMGGMGGMGGGGMQGMGGGMGGMMGGGGMGGMGMGGMGGFMNVAPDKVGKLKVPLVCLEHGKKDPNPRVKYEIKPIESFTNNANVIELCKMVGRGEVPQNAAQAAAWNLANGISWGELANKDRVKLMNGYTEKFFSPDELGYASKITVEATRRGKQNPVMIETPKQSPGQN